jgi:vacuolar-type H+-ATPase subunit I/STV1
MEKDQNFNFRQPLVTASGIILGFVLNFATDLVRQDKKGGLFSISILVATLIGIVLLVVSLYRILDNRYDREHADRYYTRTLNYVLAGGIFSFLGALVRMTYTLMIP